MATGYDIFISFSSQDIEFAQGVWEQFTKNGFRAFISDETLKERIGQSFVTAIHEALENSHNFVLLATQASLDSEWVREEYETFYTQKYVPSGRIKRLFILHDSNFVDVTLPPMLRNIQTTPTVDSIMEIIGFSSLAELRESNSRLEEQIRKLQMENLRLQSEIAGDKQPEKNNQDRSESLNLKNEIVDDKLNTHINTFDRSETNRQGLDILVSINITEIEATQGFDTTLHLPSNTLCDACEGKGYRGDDSDCVVCHGTGKRGIQRGLFSIENTCFACRGIGIELNCPMCDGEGNSAGQREIDISIPPILTNLYKLRIEGKGFESTTSSDKGDVFVSISVDGRT